jgi:hypothetical protein
VQLSLGGATWHSARHNLLNLSNARLPSAAQFALVAQLWPTVLRLHRSFTKQGPLSQWQHRSTSFPRASSHRQAQTCLSGLDSCGRPPRSWQPAASGGCRWRHPAAPAALLSARLNRVPAGWPTGPSGMVCRDVPAGACISVPERRHLLGTSGSQEAVCPGQCQPASRGISRATGIKQTCVVKGMKGKTGSSTGGRTAASRRSASAPAGQPRSGALDDAGSGRPGCGIRRGRCCIGGFCHGVCQPRLDLCAWGAVALHRHGGTPSTRSCSKPQLTTAARAGRRHSSRSRTCSPCPPPTLGPASKQPYKHTQT